MFFLLLRIFLKPKLAQELVTAVSVNPLANPESGGKPPERAANSPSLLVELFMES